MSAKTWVAPNEGSRPITKLAPLLRWMIVARATGSAPSSRPIRSASPTSWVLAANSVLLMSFTARALPTAPVSKIASA